MKKKFTLIIGFIQFSFALSILLFSANSFGQVKHVVDVLNWKYSPKELTINIGDTVEWINSSGHHNVNATQSTFPFNPESFGNAVANNWTFTHIFNTPGKYDYQCDPHTNFNMFGQIEVLEKTDFQVTVNFASMNPHSGQNFHLSVIEKETGNEVKKINTTITPEFNVVLTGIKSGIAYNIDFYADHNGNGLYDAPPVDHAWRIKLNDVIGDTILNFTHNTNFTDISITTGFENITNSTLKMYPNPAVDKVTIETEELISANVFISVYDILGKMRLSTNKAVNGKFEIDLSQLERGIYFVEIRNENMRNMLKLMKN